MKTEKETTWEEKWKTMSDTEKIENAIKNLDDNDIVGARENLSDFLTDLKKSPEKIYGGWEIDALIAKLKINQTRGFKKVIITKNGYLIVE